MRSRRKALFWTIQIAFGFALAGCASRQPAPTVAYAPVRAPNAGGAVVGKASWYGPGFNGHRTASGEIYNQHDMTAATEVYRLGSRVMVTNLSNGRSVEVEINDRGPYAKGRIVDLSYGAARAIGMIRPGTTKVRMQLVGAPASTSPRGFYVQAGSFGTRANADRIREELTGRYSNVMISETEIGSHHYYRVRMGAFQTQQQAIERAHDASGLDLPMIVVSE